MKKNLLTLLPLFIVAALCMTLASCGGSDDSDNLVPPTPTNNGGSGDASGAGGSNGYEPSVAPAGTQALDLGLPSGTLWANMNVGATTAEGAGLYFAWGETTGYGNNPSDGRLFDGNSYKYASESYPYVLKYCTQSENGTVDNKTMLELADDAARANWKGDWRMPTRDEFQELLDNTTQERTTQNGVSGIKLTSKKNGNSIFFPAIGYRLTDEMILYGEGAWYWTSSLEYDDSNRNYMDYCATAFGFGRNSTLSKTYDGRTYGLNVRAVIGKTGSQPDEPKESEPTYTDMRSTPLTLEAIADGAFTFRNNASGNVIYRIDGSKAQNIIPAKSTKTINVTAGQKVRFFGDNATYYDKSKYISSNISSTADFYAYGNVMSLVSSANYATATTLTEDDTFRYLFGGAYKLKSHPLNAIVLPATTLTTYCYDSMFSECYRLTSAPELPATKLAEGCYSGMFDACYDLTSAPVLPATTMEKKCYENMFQYCMKLISAPELPATELAESCYFGMFDNCTSLISAPKLPATTLADYCYNEMFMACHKLTTPPELPAKELTKSCYYRMFLGCNILTPAPELPATMLAERCYESMFYGCDNLTSAPELPATELAERCYEGMFASCDNLTSAPELPATKLAKSCYWGMFEDCTSLISAPKLPATTLANYCYAFMFRGCINLTSAPELPAATLVEGCYSSSFSGCTKLNNVKCKAKYNISDNCNNWLKNVASGGTFTKASGVSWTSGINGIPSGWTVIEE